MNVTPLTNSTRFETYESKNTSKVNFANLVESTESNSVQPVENTKELNQDQLFLYYNEQATQAMKSRVDTLFDSLNESSQNISDLGRLNMIQGYENIVNQEISEPIFEKWA